ncbi:hypothetical protein BDW75DRAFT_239204 [Aspergillus navahoensis]
MSDASSLDLKELQDANPAGPTSFAKLKQHVKNFKKQWGPGLAAKERWDDDYNFPPGRYAGQAADLTKRAQ